jgi:prevent-host-death family protein
MYNLYMTTMAVSQVRENIAELIDGARLSKEPVYVTRRGKTVAVIVDPEIFEELLEIAEDVADLQELSEIDPNEEMLDWEAVKAELSYTRSDPIIC